MGVANEADDNTDDAKHEHRANAGMCRHPGKEEHHDRLLTLELRQGDLAPISGLQFPETGRHLDE